MPRIMFVGDISLGEYYTSFGHGPRTYLENNNVFEKVQDIFSQADMVVGNLEAPLTNANFDPKEPESMVLRGDLWCDKKVGNKIIKLVTNAVSV